MTVRGTVLGAAALLLLGALGILFLQSTEGGAGASATVHAGERGAHAQAAVDAAGRQEEESALAAKHGRVEVDRPVSTQAPTGPTARIRVVRASDGEPLPGAEVLYYDPTFDWLFADEEIQELMFRSGYDSEVMLRRIGVRTVADAHGWVEVPFGEEWANLIGRDGKLYGEEELQLPEPLDGWRLELAPEHRVEVQVIGTDGQPVSDVAIGLWWSHVKDAGSTDAAQEESRMLGFTDAPEGIARVRLPHEWNGDGAPIAARIGIFAPGLGDCSAPIDPEAPPRERIQLRPSAFGSVAVELTDAFGEPMKDRAHITLQVVGEEMTYALLTAPGERAMYPTIGLGLRLRTATWVGQLGLETEFDGPAHAGHEVVARLRPARPQVAITGRAVDTSGRPIARTMLRMRVAYDGGETSHAIATTGDDGRFREVLEDGAAGRSAEILAERWQSLRDTTGERATIRTGVLGPFDTDVGDVVFHAAPLLVSGSLLERGGAPARITSLWIESRTADGTEWEGVPEVGVKLEPGRFQVSGTPPPAPLRLRLHGDRYLPLPPLPFAVGRDDLEIVLDVGGSLRAEFLVPEALLGFAETLQIELCGDGEPHDVWPRTADGRWLLLWRGLPSGIYWLAVRSNGELNAAVEIGDIAIRAGEETLDPRLLPLDLREVFRVARLRCVDPEGNPLTEVYGTVVTRGALRPGEYHGFSLWNGQSRVVTTADTLDLCVLLSDHHPVEYRGPVRDTDVVVPSNMPVRIRVGRLDLPPGVQARVALKRQARASDPWDQLLTDYPHLGEFLSTTRRYCRLDTEGNGTLKLPRGGDFAAALHLNWTAGGEERSEDVTVQPPRMRLRYLAGGHDAAFTVDEDQLRAVLEQIRNSSGR